MSAIARYYKRRGCEVSGYDRTPSPLTAELEAEGMSIHYEPDCNAIPENIQDTLVIYTPAIPADMPELMKVERLGYHLVKRSRALGEICLGQNCLAVAGTHGKSTTTTLIAHIMSEAGGGASAFLGGIAKNYNTNLLVSDSRTIVAEADEFDRSFLQLHPSMAVITAMDADHLDIYGDLEHVHEAYRQFASQVREALIIKYGLPISANDTQARLFNYHFDNSAANFHSENLVLESDGHYRFDLVYPSGRITGIRPGVLGWVNVENSVAAAAVCLLQGVDPQGIKAAIGSFKGVVRRLDEQLNRNGICYIDDYAHHPAELAAAISSIRRIFPGRKLTGIFQPHLYTRTRDFAAEFAEALSALDKLILLDIYPARELPIEGVTSEIIFKDVTCPEKVMVHKEELMDLLRGEKIDVLCSFGAGDIDRFVGPIRQMLEERV